MVFDAIRGYIQLASGLTELSRTRVTEAANAVLNLPTTMASGEMAAQVTALAEEILAAATANRASLVAIVRTEVENAVGRAGLVPAADLERARAGLVRLSAELEELRTQMLGSAAVRSATQSGATAFTGLTGRRAGEISPGLGTNGLEDADTGRFAADQVSPRLSADDGSMTTTAAARSVATTVTDRPAVGPGPGGASPANKPTSETKEASARKSTTAKKTRATTASTADGASPAHKTTATKASTAAGGSRGRKTTAKKGSIATNGSPPRKASTAGEASSGRKTTAKKATTTRKPSTAKKTSPAKRGATAKKRSPVKRTTASKTSATRSTEGQGQS